MGTRAGSLTEYRRKIADGKPAKRSRKENVR